VLESGGLGRDKSAHPEELFFCGLSAQIWTDTLGFVDAQTIGSFVFLVMIRGV
jgi:hypothetical protein